MILPIVAYGDPVLRQETKTIGLDYPQLQDLVANMFETMYAANGVGLAAPQVGVGIRLFVIDSTPMHDDDSSLGYKQAFINPEIVEESGEVWMYEEGCLSIPGIRGDVARPRNIVMTYDDLAGAHHEVAFSGMDARVIQHEYDHLEGKLFTEYLSSLRKQLIKNKLADITKGKVSVDYRMRFPRR
jgi:peptide deformylase